MQEVKQEDKQEDKQEVKQEVKQEQKEKVQGMHPQECMVKVEVVVKVVVNHMSVVKVVVNAGAVGEVRAMVVETALALLRRGLSQLRLSLKNL